MNPINEALLTEKQAAATLNVSLACLRRWRRIGSGPRFTRLTRLVRYEPSAVREFVEKCTVSPEDGEVGNAEQV